MSPKPFDGKTSSRTLRQKASERSASQGLTLDWSLWPLARLWRRQATSRRWCWRTAGRRRRCETEPGISSERCDPKSACASARPEPPPCWISCLGGNDSSNRRRFRRFMDLPVPAGATSDCRRDAQSEDEQSNRCRATRRNLDFLERSSHNDQLTSSNNTNIWLFLALLRIFLLITTNITTVTTQKYYALGVSHYSENIKTWTKGFILVTL